MVEQVPQQVVEQPPQKSNKIFIFAFIMLFLLVTASAIGLWFWESSRLVVEDQPLDDLLTVERVVLYQPGFITVYNTNSLGERGSFLLGRTTQLEPGIYERFTIDINTEVTNQAGERLLKSGDQLIFSVQVGSETNQNIESSPPARSIFGRELKKIITLF